MISLSIRCIENNQNKMLEFEIEDTGIGIKDEHQSKLFKLFGMVHDDNGSDDNVSNCNLNPNGSGIGLTVSKKYLKYLGGDINLSSIYGKGTIVRFCIPLIQPNPNQQSGFIRRKRTFSEDLPETSENVQIKKCFLYEDALASKHVFKRL